MYIVFTLPYWPKDVQSFIFVGSGKDNSISCTVVHRFCSYDVQKLLVSPLIVRYSVMKIFNRSFAILCLNISFILKLL